MLLESSEARDSIDTLQLLFIQAGEKIAIPNKLGFFNKILHRR
jgi:hypothetical protein